MSTELNKVYTITFGDVAENHAKMQKIGTLHENGYSVQQLVQIQQKLTGLGLTTELVDLNVGFNESFSEAKVLVIRRGAQFILGEETTAGLMAENDGLTMDKMALMKGKVVNKVARWNLCFADEDQEPNYEDGKGRVVAWKHLPKMARIRQVISEWTEDVLLNGEANYYYDLSQCGIGFHGDGERRKVFAVRMGATMPIYFKWYQNSESVGQAFEVVLNDGDMYIMSEKTVGFDWLKKKIPTLRHSTGCSKFTGVKNADEEQVEAQKQQKEAEKQAEKQQKEALEQTAKAEKAALRQAEKAIKDAEKAQKMALEQAEKQQKEAERLAVKAQKEALEQTAKAEKAALKQAEKAIKDAEKAQKQAVEQAEKAQKLAEKEAEKAQKLAEKEAEKEAKKKAEKEAKKKGGKSSK